MSLADLIAQAPLHWAYGEAPPTTIHNIDGVPKAVERRRWLGDVVAYEGEELYDVLPVIGAMFSFAAAGGFEACESAAHACKEARALLRAAGSILGEPWTGRVKALLGVAEEASRKALAAAEGDASHQWQCEKCGAWNTEPHCPCDAEGE